MKKRVRLELWVVYDSEDGYVWPQVTAKKPDYLCGENAKLNLPHKALRLVSEVYTYDDKRHRPTGSFGTEIEDKEEESP